MQAVAQCRDGPILRENHGAASEAGPGDLGPQYSRDRVGEIDQRVDLISAGPVRAGLTLQPGPILPPRVATGEIVDQFPECHVRNVDRERSRGVGPQRGEAPFTVVRNSHQLSHAGQVPLSEQLGRPSRAGAFGDAEHHHSAHRVLALPGGLCEVRGEPGPGLIIALKPLADPPRRHGQGQFQQHLVDPARTQPQLLGIEVADLGE